MEVPTEELRMEILSFGDGIADSDKIADEGQMSLYIIIRVILRIIERTKVSTCPFLPLLFSSPLI